MSFEELEEILEGRVQTDQESVEEVQGDFGRIVKKAPKAVVTPASSQDVQKTIEFALERGISVTPQGAAHSQSGQSLNYGGIILDLGGLSEISEAEGETVWVGAGVVWRDLVRSTYQRGKLPRVLTNNLGVTIGGTLSMAGLGVSSHRYGAQVDNVLELEVVTGEGHLVRCSPSENSELFDCSRSGLGQFSVITGARIQLRDVAPRARTYYLLYDDIATLMKDQETIIREDRFHYIESWCSPCPQGLRRVGQMRMPFAEWFYPMQVTVEYEAPPDDEALLAGLNYFRQVHAEDTTILEFANRLEPVFELWKQAGTWDRPHPWMEVVLPWKVAANYIQGVLANFPPNLLVGGHVLLWPCRGTTSDAPMFRHPGGELVMGFGILPAVPSQFLPLALPVLNKASDLCLRVGGSRYLSGWVEFTEEQWEAHFGEVWPRLLEWKRFYDPKGILSPGFIKYPSSVTG
jgi:FAD/FMN-containing dehydrogenase